MKNYSMWAHEFLQILLNFKNKEKQGNYDIKVFSESILWLESNNTFINYLIKPIEEIAKNDEMFIEKFTIFIDKNKIEFPRDQNKIYKKLVNEIFFIFVDQIMSYLIEDLVIVLETKGDQDFYNKISIFLNVLPNFRILNNGLKLLSKILIKFTFLTELINISTTTFTLSEIKVNLVKIFKFEHNNFDTFE